MAANEKQLREALILAFESLREHQSTISTLLSEVAALRDSLCELGPKYDDILSQHRAKHARIAKQLVVEAVQHYDAIIQKLRSDS